MRFSYLLKRDRGFTTEKCSPGISASPLRSTCNLLPTPVLPTFQIILRFIFYLHFHCCCLSPESPWGITSLVYGTICRLHPVLFWHPFSLLFPSLHPIEETRNLIFFCWSLHHKLFSSFPFFTGKYSHSLAHGIALQTCYTVVSPYLTRFTLSPLFLPLTYTPELLRCSSKAELLASKPYLGHLVLHPGHHFLLFHLISLRS